MRIPQRYWAILVLASACQLPAQSLFYCQFGDDYLPVASVKGGVPLCFTGDSLVKGNAKDAVLAKADQFGEGFVEIEILKNDRDGVENHGGVLKFKDSRSWYILVCRLIPDRDMVDCYASIGFDSYGKKSYILRSLGNLKAGEPKMLNVYLKLNYEMPEQLHVFSGMDEIRSTLLPTEYQYYQGQLVTASK